MANMFSGNTTKTVPKTLNECIQIDAVSENLWIWSERLERWGRILFYVLIIVGIIATCVTASETQELLDEVYNDVSPFELAQAGIEIPSVSDVVIDSLWKWGLYAFLEYCAYHVLALLIGALASITQNTIISANIAVFQANASAPAAATSQPTNTPLGVRTIIEDDKWICGHCKATNSMNYSQCKKCGQYRSS